MILNQVINEFLEIDDKSIDYIKISEIKESKFMKNISSYFIPIIKKILFIPEKFYKSTQFFIFNIINKVIRIIGLDVKYCNKLIRYFSKGIISFHEFIVKYNLPEQYFKEYYYSAFSGLFFLIFGKINNFKLYDTITRLWIIVDNIFDNNCNNEYYNILKKDLYNFFINSHFKNSNKRRIFFDNSNGGPIIDCLKNIEELKISEKKKNKLFIRFYKLFKFSYESGGYGEKIESGEGIIRDFDILRNSCLKTKKSMDIFFYAIKYKKKKEDAYKIFHLSLIIQLLDDLMDIRKDKLEGKITIFTKGDILENTNNAIKLFQLIQNSKIIHDYNFNILYEALFILFIDLNDEFFEKTFIQNIRENCSIMDLKYYNMRNIDSIIRLDLIKKISYLYE